MHGLHVEAYGTHVYFTPPDTGVDVQAEKKKEKRKHRVRREEKGEEKALRTFVNFAKLFVDSLTILICLYYLSNICAILVAFVLF